MVVRAANGTKLELAGETTVNIRLGNDNILIPTLVSHDIDVVMLGYDFLTENDCVWSFGANQIIIRGNSYITFARQGQPKCRRLFVTTDIIIPAKQEINLPVRSTINSLTVCGGNYITLLINYITEPRKLQPGVFLGRTIYNRTHTPYTYTSCPLLITILQLEQ